MSDDDKVYALNSGDCLKGKVISSAQGGLILELSGFLPGDETLPIGTELYVQVLSVQKGRLLLAQPGSFSASGKIADGKTHEAAVKILASDDNAFEYSSNGRPPYFKIRRATDMMMSGPDADHFEFNSIEGLRRFLLEMEERRRTGCCKISCEEPKSRGALLFNKGKCVGCIYTNQTIKSSLPMEESLAALLNDCGSAAMQAAFYDWPDDVVLAMSSLFMGSSLQPSADGDAREYMEQSINLFGKQNSTGCLTFTLGMTGAILFAFIHKGSFVGSFYVEIQQFSRNKSFVHNLITQNPNASAAASILLPQTIEDSEFGLQLSARIPACN